LRKQDEQQSLRKEHYWLFPDPPVDFLDHVNCQIASTTLAASASTARCEVNNHRDDGTFLTGLIMAFLMILSAAGGYWVRDIGITFKVQSPPVHEVRK
jgi:hypothetical protein